MYNYDFKDEKVVYECNNCFAEIKGKELFVNVLVTDKNVLLFYNKDQDFVAMKSKGVFVTPSNDLIMSISLDNIDYQIDENNTLINNGEIILYDLVLNIV